MNRWKRIAPVLIVVGGLATIGMTQAGAASGFRSGQQIDITLADSASGTWTQAVTVGAPFSSGQTIDVLVPANRVLPARAGLTIAECAAPDGVPPSTPGGCDAVDAVRAPTHTDPDGSFTDATYVVHALTDRTTAGPSGPRTGPVTCGSTRTTECVLYVGTDVRDFTQPHFWSQGFVVDTFAGDRGLNPGDGTPPRPPNRLDGLVASSLAAASQQSALQSTCSIGQQPDSTCAINQTISVAVSRTCPDGSSGGASCGGGNEGGGGNGGGGGGGNEGGGGNGGGGGNSGGGNEGGGGQNNGLANGSSSLPFTAGTAGSSSGGGPSGVLAFTGSDPGSLVLLGSAALVVGWLLQRRRSIRRRRIVD